MNRIYRMSVKTILPVEQTCADLQHEGPRHA